MSATDGAILAASAFLAGVVNSIAGGGTLLSFPALLSVGMDARIANATSTVALWPGSIGAAWGYRRELSGTRPVLWRLALPSLLGGATGAGLLLWTPSATFQRLAPWLILGATLLFAAQDLLQRRLPREEHAGPVARGGLFVAQFAVAVYGGYFGAGMGILLLTILTLLGVADIHEANGAKNVLGFAINGVAVFTFAFSGLVSWPEAALMAGGAILGGYGGAGLARKLGRKYVRHAVVAVGFIIGVAMLVR